jgi:very-short-patch-repair endonuclease
LIPEIARKLRVDQTTAESILWHQLRSRQVRGRKWRRQHPVGPYVVDFLCFQVRLIVEIDGDVHAFQREQDEARQAYLESYGFCVIRFSNDDIFHNLEGVLQTIWELSEKRQTPSP